MKAVLAAFNQEKALVGAFSVITNLRMELFEALVSVHVFIGGCYGGGCEVQSCAGADWRVRRSVRVTGLLQLGTGTLYCTLYHVTLCII